MFGGALRSNKLRLYESRNRDFRYRKLEVKGGGGRTRDVSYQGDGDFE